MKPWEERGTCTVDLLRAPQATHLQGDHFIHMRRCMGEAGGAKGRDVPAEPDDGDGSGEIFIGDVARKTTEDPRPLEHGWQDMEAGISGLKRILHGIDIVLFI
ncbi:hypothetical protein VPH35_099350 [Triticum aestivum]|uniref:Uncharacterized protein n=1 Tax=Aegilops tauschii TaxID=37682 RepID=M8CKH2_AEGTA